SARPRGRGLGRDAHRDDARQSRQVAPNHRGIRCARGCVRARRGTQVRMIDSLAQPFIEFAFMRRALVGSLAISLTAPPIGVFLVLRRMSLMGDAMGHAILPGAAIGYLLAGLSLFAMSLGGFAAGLAVALAAGLVARSTV